MRLIRFPTILNYGLDDITNATVADKDADKSSFSLLSYFGRVNYSYDNRYLFTGTLRYDGSSKFGPENQYGLFPSAALAWRASEESFIKDLNIFSNLKPRVSFGITGNQDGIGTYPAYALFGSNG